MTKSIEQLKKEQALFTIFWNLYKKYAGINNESEWEQYVKESNELFNQYKNGPYEKAVCKMVGAVTMLLEKDYKENKANG